MTTKGVGSPFEGAKGEIKHEEPKHQKVLHHGRRFHHVRKHSTDEDKLKHKFAETKGSSSKHDAISWKEYFSLKMGRKTQAMPASATVSRETIEKEARFAREETEALMGKPIPAKCLPHLNEILSTPEGIKAYSEFLNGCFEIYEKNVEAVLHRTHDTSQEKKEDQIDVNKFFDIIEKFCKKKPMEASAELTTLTTFLQYGVSPGNFQIVTDSIMRSVLSLENATKGSGPVSRFARGMIKAANNAPTATPVEHVLSSKGYFEHEKGEFWKSEWVGGTPLPNGDKMFIKGECHIGIARNPPLIAKEGTLHLDLSSLEQFIDEQSYKAVMESVEIAVNSQAQSNEMRSQAETIRRIIDPTLDRKVHEKLAAKGKEASPQEIQLMKEKLFEKFIKKVEDVSVHFSKDMRKLVSALHYSFGTSAFRHVSDKGQEYLALSNVRTLLGQDHAKFNGELHALDEHIDDPKLKDALLGFSEICLKSRQSEIHKLAPEASKHFVNTMIQQQIHLSEVISGIKFKDPKIKSQLSKLFSKIVNDVTNQIPGYKTISRLEAMISELPQPTNDKEIAKREKEVLAIEYLMKDSLVERSVVAFLATCDNLHKAKNSSEGDIEQLKNKLLAEQQDVIDAINQTHSGERAYKDNALDIFSKLTNKAISRYFT